MTCLRPGVIRRRRPDPIRFRSIDARDFIDSELDDIATRLDTGDRDPRPVAPEPAQLAPAPASDLSTPETPAAPARRLPFRRRLAPLPPIRRFDPANTRPHETAYKPDFIGATDTPHVPRRAPPVAKPATTIEQTPASPVAIRARPVASVAKVDTDRIAADLGGNSHGPADLLTPGETAQRLRIAEKTLERWRSEKRGPAWLKVGRRILYPASVVQSWLAQEAKGPAKAAASMTATNTTAKQITACPYIKDTTRWHVDVNYTHPITGKADRKRRVAPAGLSLEQAIAWGQGERLRIVTELALGTAAKSATATDTRDDGKEHSKPSKVPTVADVWPEFMTGHIARQKYSTQKGYRSAAKWILSIGDTRLDRIDGPKLEALKDAMLAAVDQSTAQNYMAKVVKLIRWCMVKGKTPRTMIPTVEWVRESKEQLAVYSAAELERMIAAARDPYMRVLALLLADGCLRIGECAGLQWADIGDGMMSITRNVIDGQVQDSPKGESGDVPLTPRLAAALDALRATGESDTWVLPRRSNGRRRLRAYDHSHEGTLATWVSDLQTAAGLTAHGAHRVRHSRLTLLAERNVPIRSLQHLARHASEKTTERYYLHVRKRALAAVAVAEIAAMTETPAPAPVGNDTEAVGSGARFLRVA